MHVFSSILLTEKETIMCRVFLCLPTQVIGSIHQINEKYMSITCISISLTVDDSRNNLTKITAFRGLYSTKNKMIPRSVPILYTVFIYNLMYGICKRWFKSKIMGHFRIVTRPYRKINKASLFMTCVLYALIRCWQKKIFCTYLRGIFSSNQIIHEISFILCFWASDHLFHRFL